MPSRYAISAPVPAAREAPISALTEMITAVTLFCITIS
jgi:hypothetical protein